MENHQRDVAHQILTQRRKQIAGAGYSPVHDDQWTGGELLFAALAHVCVPGDALWPWDPARFHPSADPVENIVAAGALVAAEGDRLMRRRERGLPVVGGLIVLGMDPEEILRNVDGLREIRAEMNALTSPNG